MKIDNINKKIIKRRNTFVVIRDIFKAKSVIRILDNLKFAKKNTKSFFSDSDGVTICTTCRYIGCINGQDLFEWNEYNSCTKNSSTLLYYITNKDKQKVNIKEEENIKKR